MKNFFLYLIEFPFLGILIFKMKINQKKNFNVNPDSRGKFAKENVLPE